MMYIETSQLKQETRSKLKQDRLGWTKVALPMIVVTLTLFLTRFYMILRVFYNFFGQIVTKGFSIGLVFQSFSTIVGIQVIMYVLSYVTIVVEILQAGVAQRKVQGEDVSARDVLTGNKDWGYILRLALTMWLSASFLPKLIPALGNLVSIGLSLFYVSVPYMTQHQDADSALNTLKNNFAYGKHYIGTYIKLVYGYYLYDWLLVGLTFGMWGIVLYPKLLVAKTLLFSELAQSLLEEGVQY